MDKPIRKFILWKCRHPEKLEERLYILRQRKEEILDESSSGMDGQPKAKYSFGDVVANKALRRAQVDYAIQKVEYEQRVLKEFPNTLNSYDRRIYDETIAKESNLDAKADLMRMNRKRLIQERGRIVRQIAEILGEYADEDK